MTYNSNNIFAKILRGDMACNKVAENDVALAFQDVCPKAKIHILIIPKGAYVDCFDFYEKANLEEIKGYYTLLNEVIVMLKIREEGFRLITNSGEYGNQVVPHFHTHLVGGERLGHVIL